MKNKELLQKIFNVFKIVWKVLNVISLIAIIASVISLVAIILIERLVTFDGESLSQVFRAKLNMHILNLYFTLLLGIVIGIVGRLTSKRMYAYHELEEKHKTPFNKEGAKVLRKAAIFYIIASVVLSIVIGILIAAFTLIARESNTNLEPISIEGNGIFLGLALLLASLIFEVGAIEIENKEKE